MDTKQTDRDEIAFEMWVYRRIGHILWKEKKTDKSVLKNLKMKQELLKEMKI
jgi:chaperonin cofactor prefoldin